MGEGGDEDGGHGQKRDAGVKGVQGRKDLSSVGVELGDQAHAAEEHRGVQEGIDPGELIQEAKAEDAEGDGEADQGEDERGVNEDSPEKEAPR